MTTEQSASMDAALNDVFSPGRGRHDDTATPEVAETIQTPAATPEAAPQTEAEREDPVDHNKQVSVKEVFDEREKKRAYKAQYEAEQKRAATFEAQLKTLQEQNQHLIQGFSRPQPTAAPVQQRQPVQAPDPVVDPVGYNQFVTAQIQQSLLVRDLNNSEDRAREKHGDGAVDAAFKAAEGVFSQADWRALMNKRHPYGELVNWHKSHTTIQTVGTDLEAYKQKLEAEVRAKVLEELKSGKAPAAVPGQAQQQAPQSFPGTLAAATQQGPTGQITKNLEAATGDVFASDRKVRGMRR